MITGAPAPSPTFLGSDSVLLCGRLAFGCGSPVVDSRAGASACGGRPNPRTSHLVVASPSAAAPRTSLASHPGAASAVGVRTLVLPIAWSPRLRLRLPVRSSPLTLGRASAVGVRTLALPIAWSPRLRLRLPVRPSPLTLGRHRQWASALSHFLSRGRLAFGCGSPYITGPMIQGANFSSPAPESSAVARGAVVG